MTQTMKKMLQTCGEGCWACRSPIITCKSSLYHLRTLAFPIKDFPNCRHQGVVMASIFFSFCQRRSAGQQDGCGSKAIHILLAFWVLQLLPGLWSAWPHVPDVVIELDNGEYLRLHWWVWLALMASPSQTHSETSKEPDGYGLPW